MKKALLALALIFLTAIQSQAVLKEKDLARTMNVLYLELQSKHAQQKENLAKYEQMRETQHNQLVDYMQECEQIGLILYSQNIEFTFDVAYACQEATDMHRKLHEKVMPYNKIKVFIEREIARYDSLIYALEQLPPITGDALSKYKENDSLLMSIANDEKEATPFVLDKEHQKVRESCLRLAKSLRDNLKKVLKKIEKDSAYYSAVSKNVERLNNYANERYSILQRSIFIDRGNSYFAILMSLPIQISRTSVDLKQKYRTLGAARYSQWRGGIVIFCSVFIIIYISVAAIISYALLRWCLPKKLKVKFFAESYKHKRPIAILSLALILFAVIVMILRAIIIKNNLMFMASGAMINFAWMAEAIYASLLIRLKNDQIKEGAKVYAPFILMSLVVIWFRIILIPNSLVNLIFPPILLFFAIWQLVTIKKSQKHIPMSDKIYSSISLVVLLGSCVLSWIGYTLMAVQIIVWWMFQLSAIATIICCYDLMELYETKVLAKRIKNAYEKDVLAKRIKNAHGGSVTDKDIVFHMKRGDFIKKTWAYDLINKAIVPVAGVASIFISVFLAAAVFEIRDLCVEWFTTDIIDFPGYIRLSLLKVSGLAASFFVFKYIEYLIRSAYFGYRRSNTEKTFNATLAKNIIAIGVWGTYFIAALILLDVPRSGIEYALTGLTAGLGFASKDLLENFVYGISLMTGRVRVGDYVECDGITGKVESISYQSTQIITLDGSVVAFLNSQLFTKNFKNLTRNHQYELVKIPFGVAYGSNVDEVRKYIIDGFTNIKKKTEDNRDIIKPKHSISVAFSDFGDNSVDLFLVAWVLVDQKIPFIAEAKEKIYNILNQHNIEIPFPQRDVYIRSIVKTE
ncbi:MAG: mechanosensitive ion channel [Prevotellaceae bacterium]|nr:mechanosensitive ion channel [Candidatus Minthosoma caballi]